MLHRLDLPAILHLFLADPIATRPAATALAAALPRLLSSVEDGRARRLVARIVPRILGGPGAGAVVARALRGLVEGGRHQEVLTFLLAEIKGLLARRAMGEILFPAAAGTFAVERIGNRHLRAVSHEVHVSIFVGHSRRTARANNIRKCDAHNHKGTGGRNSESPPNILRRSSKSL